MNVLVKVAATTAILAAATGCTSPSDTGTDGATASTSAAPPAFTAVPEATVAQHLTQVPLDAPVQKRLATWRSATQPTETGVRVQRKALGCDAGSVQFPADANVLDFVEVIDPPIAGTPLTSYQVTVYRTELDAVATLSAFLTDDVGHCTASRGRDVTLVRTTSLEIGGKTGVAERYTFADGSTARARTIATRVENVVVLGRVFADADVPRVPGRYASVEKTTDAIVVSLADHR